MTESKQRRERGKRKEVTNEGGKEEDEEDVRDGSGQRENGRRL
jgi:hypothetical protein